MLRITLLTIMALYVASANAQVTVSEVTDSATVATPESSDTVTALDESIRRSASPLAAVPLGIASAIVPGSAHIIAGNPQKSIAFLTVDAALILGTVFTYTHANDLYSDSRAFAYQHAGTHSQRSPSDRYWRTIGNENFLTVNAWNTAAEQSSDTSAQYLATTDAWSWEDPTYIKSYVQIRNKAATYQTASYFFLAGLLANRVASLLDFRFSLARGEIVLIDNVDARLNIASRSGSMTISGTF